MKAGASQGMRLPFAFLGPARSAFSQKTRTAPMELKDWFEPFNDSYVLGSFVR